MPGDSQNFRDRAALAIKRAARGSAADDPEFCARIADAIIAEFAKPTDAMIDAAYEAVRFDEAWAINSRRDFVKAVKAMVRSTFVQESTSPARPLKHLPDHSIQRKGTAAADRNGDKNNRQK
jgi:hypothetical protein